jgi:hypothetical protein
MTPFYMYFIFLHNRMVTTASVTIVLILGSPRVTNNNNYALLKCYNVEYFWVFILFVLKYWDYCALSVILVQ